MLKYKIAGVFLVCVVISLFCFSIGRHLEYPLKIKTRLSGGDPVVFNSEKEFNITVHRNQTVEITQEEEP